MEPARPPVASPDRRPSDALDGFDTEFGEGAASCFKSVPLLCQGINGSSSLGRLDGSLEVVDHRGAVP